MLKKKYSLSPKPTGIGPTFPPESIHDHLQINKLGSDKSTLVHTILDSTNVQCNRNWCGQRGKNRICHTTKCFTEGGKIWLLCIE